MPGYKGHLAGGALLYSLLLLVAYQWLQPSLLTAGEWLLFILAGSLFPDIDVKSKGQHIFYGLLFLFFLMLLVYGCCDIVAYLGILALIPLLSHHRGLFHNPWFLLLFPAIVGMSIAVCSPKWAYAVLINTIFFIIGAFSHILLDRGLRGIMR